MYSYRVGGKKGHQFQLEVSPNHVVVRAKRGVGISRAKLSKASKRISKNLLRTRSIPEANVAVYECIDPAGKHEQLRDDARAQFKKESDIRFAGRALRDKISKELFLYTENFFVKFRSDVPREVCLSLINEYGMTVKQQLGYAANAFFTEAKGGTGFEIFTMAGALLDKDETEYCHPELVQERRFKNVHPMQWHLTESEINGHRITAHIQAREAWHMSRGQGVTIAVIDDGFDLDHPEFRAPGKIVHPYDAFHDTENPSPKYASENHGTACAGVACASGLNGTSGVAPDALLMPIRSGNLGSMSEANAFVWAADHGADIISCSWGPPDGQWWSSEDNRHNSYTPLFDSTRLAIDYAVRNGRNGLGCSIFWAAGNGNEDVEFDGYASYDKLVAVAACNDQGKRSVYSDYGKSIWCCFPSNDFPHPPSSHPTPLTPGIWTTDRSQNKGYNDGGMFTHPNEGDPDGNYVATFGGTSSACPGAAGVAALMLAANPGLNWMQVRDIIGETSDKIDQQGGFYKNDHSIYYGFGRVNAQRAVLMASQVALLETDTDAQLNGYAMLRYSGRKAIRGGQVREVHLSGERLIGVSLAIDGIDDLGIEYKLVLNGHEEPAWCSGGEHAGTFDRRRKAIGFIARLTGGRADQYALTYQVLLRGSNQWEHASNDIWCGHRTGTGEAIQEVLLNLTKRSTEG